MTDEVRPEGNFLAPKHTGKHFNEEIRIPQMLDRRVRKLEAAGRRTFEDRASEKVRLILENYRLEPTVVAVRNQVKEI